MFYWFFLVVKLLIWPLISLKVVHLALPSKMLDTPGLDFIYLYKIGMCHYLFIKFLLPQKAKANLSSVLNGSNTKAIKSPCSSAYHLIPFEFGISELNQWCLIIFILQFVDSLLFIQFEIMQNKF